MSISIMLWPAPKAIFEWFKGSALRPYLNALDAEAATKFAAAYAAEVAKA